MTNNFFSIPTSILYREACLPPIISYCRYKRRLAALRIACAPPTGNPASAWLRPSFPSLYAFRAQDTSQHLTKGLSCIYLPLNWRTRVPSPPIRNHLPVDALSHLSLPLQEGLTCLPLVLHTPSPLGMEIPPRTHEQNLPGPQEPRYEPASPRVGRRCTHSPILEYPPSVSPHPFLDLGKFVAGRIHQILAGKSYLAAHPSWFDEDPDRTGLRCGIQPEFFPHAILTSSFLNTC